MISQHWFSCDDLVLSGNKPLTEPLYYYTARHSVSISICNSNHHFHLSQYENKSHEHHSNSHTKKNIMKDYQKHLKCSKLKKSSNRIILDTMKNFNGGNTIVLVFHSSELLPWGPYVFGKFKQFGWEFCPEGYLQPSLINSIRESVKNS